MTTLHLPLPPTALSPNSRAGRWPRIKAASKYREECGWIASEAKVRHRGPTTVQYTFRFKIARRRDPDNFVARMKPGLDGIRDSGMIADDSSSEITMLPPRFESGAETDEVVVDIAPATPAPKRLAPKEYYDTPPVTR